MTVLVNSVFPPVLQELNALLSPKNALSRRTSVKLVSLFDLELRWLAALRTMVQISCLLHDIPPRFHSECFFVCHVLCTSRCSGWLHVPEVRCDKG